MSDALRTTESTSPPLAFGGRIRDLRHKAGLTLQALADQAGISVGFLSQVERDKATPSLGTLAGLAGALNVEVDHFIANPRPADSLTRAAERPRFAVADSAIAYERLTTSLPGGVLSSVIMHLPVGYVSEVNSHAGEELMLVLEGRIRHRLGDADMLLGPGDSLHFMGDIAHSLVNIGDVPARLLWAGTSPRLIGRSPDSP